MAPKTKEERLWGAACLRVTLEKSRGPEATAGNEIYQETLKDLGLTEGEVEGYLRENRTVVEHALASRGQPRS